MWSSDTDSQMPNILIFTYDNREFLKMALLMWPLLVNISHRAPPLTKKSASLCIPWSLAQWTQLFVDQLYVHCIPESPVLCHSGAGDSGLNQIGNRRQFRRSSIKAQPGQEKLSIDWATYQFPKTLLHSYPPRTSNFQEEWWVGRKKQRSKLGVNF